jgi:hypothetical protein
MHIIEAKRYFIQTYLMMATFLEVAGNPTWYCSIVYIIFIYFTIGYLGLTTTHDFERKSTGNDIINLLANHVHKF